MLEKKFGSKQTGLFGVVLLVVFALSACASNKGIEKDGAQSRTVSPDTPHVAVLPFENLSEHPNAGQILTQLMNTELYQQGAFLIREESALLQQLRNEKEGDKQTRSVPRAQQLAHKLGVDAVLLGSVTEYRYQHGLREEPVVGLSVRMVRGCDGQVVWASSQSVTGRGFIHRDSLNQAAQRVVHTLATELQQLDANELRCSTSLLDNAGDKQVRQRSTVAGEAEGSPS